MSKVPALYWITEKDRNKSVLQDSTADYSSNFSASFDFRNKPPGKKPVPQYQQYILIESVVFLFKV